MDNNRIVIHVDLNSYFATAEQQANPRLRAKPIGIIKAKNRTCLIATSIEAKKYGIKTGTPLEEAKKLCPQIILVEADFEKYEDITYRFINICKTYSPACEVFSLDECFIDVTKTENLFGGVVNIALEIKDRLNSEIGDYMTCSVGISHNRLLAKLASSLIKKDGLFIIEKQNALSVLDSCRLTDVIGIGWGLYNHLIKLGIDTFPKLRSCSLAWLVGHFGPFWSHHLYNIARGCDSSHVNPFTALNDAKSVGRTYTTHRNLYKKEEMKKLMRNLCEETAAKARKMNQSGRYIGLCLRGGNTNFWGHKTLKNYTADGKQIFDICALISKNWRLPYLRFCGITLSMLTKNEYLTTHLFEKDRKREALLLAIDKINSSFGDYTLYPAQLLKTEIVRPEVTGYFGDKKFRLNFLRND